MKNKLLISLCALCPLVVLLAGINLIIDPANIYNAGYERTIADYLHQGKNVSNVYNYDERLLQKDFIQGLSSAPDVVALGSSRIMLLNKSFFPAKKFINSGVSGATVQDLYAIFYLYEKKGKLPKEIILSLDPWLLNPNHGQTRWKTLARTYQEAYNTIHGKDEIIWAVDYDYTKLTEFLSLDYFQSSIEFMQGKKIKKLIPADSPCNKEFTRETDGSICYGEIARNKTPDEVKESAENYISRPNTYLSKFDHISQKGYHDLDTLIGYMQCKNIKVKLELSPYNPIVYNYFKSNEFTFKVQETERLYNKLAEKHHIPLIGSFDPTPFGFGPDIYYDGMHFKERALAQMLKGKL